MLEPSAVRIYAARRAAVEQRLTGAGVPQDVAEEWIGAWEAHAAEVGLDRDARDFWQQADAWIAAARRRR